MGRRTTPRWIRKVIYDELTMRGREHFRVANMIATMPDGPGRGVGLNKKKKATQKDGPSVTEKTR